MATVAGGRSWAQDRFPSADTPPDGELAKDLATTEAADDGLARGGGQVNRGMGHVAAADISAVREPMRRAIATDASVSMDQIRCAPYPVLGGRGQSTTRPLQFPRDPESDESPDDSATTSSSSSACDHAEAGRDCDPGSGRGGGVCDTGEGSFAPCGVTSVLRFRNLSHSVASRARKNVFCKINTSKIAPLPSDESAASDEIHIHVDAGRNGSGSSTDNLKPVISHSAADIGRTAHDSDRSSSSRRILVDISGSAKSGQITAIMGASGAGKTTLLNILACRIASGRRAGEVELDGLPVRSGTMRRVSAYVMQDDIMFPSLTVRETLMFAAELRLPQGVRREEKAAKVARLLELLGLAEVAETKIGDEGQRGVSGGERKRVAIGTEIICDPKILFLDEPTSGLDSTSAFRVVRAIKDIATNTNSIAVMVLHQPSFRVLGLVDRLILLASGHAVFHGAPPALPRFLESVGFPVPQFANSTEYALDLIEDMQRSSRGVADLVEFAREYERQQEEEEEREMKLGKLEEEAALRCVPSIDFMFLPIPIPCHAIPRHDIPYNPIPYNAISCHAISYNAISCHAIPCHASSPSAALSQERNIFLRETSSSAYRPSTYLLSSTLVYLPLHLLTLYILPSLPTSPTLNFPFPPPPPVSGAEHLPAGDQQQRLPPVHVPALLHARLPAAAPAHGAHARARGLVRLNHPSFLLHSSLPLSSTFHGIPHQQSVHPLHLCTHPHFPFSRMPSFPPFLPLSSVVLAYAVAIALMAYFALLSGFYIDRESIPEVWMWLHYLSPMKYAYEALAINEFGR
ncbi:unnamed protein product [Closterium sp. NIES-54]